MNIALKVLSIVTALIGVGYGSTIVETESFLFVPNGNSVLTFNKFDTMGDTRTLSSVTISVIFNKTGGSYEVDNDSAETASVNLTHQVLGVLSNNAGVLSLLAADGESFIGASGSLNATSTLTGQYIAASTGDATNAFNATGLGDYIKFEPVETSASTSGVVHNSQKYNYVGPGTFAITFTANQSVEITGVGGAQQTFTNSSVDGTVTVTYEYVPEPSSALLVCIGALGLLRRRR